MIFWHAQLWCAGQDVSKFRGQAIRAGRGKLGDHIIIQGPATEPTEKPLLEGRKTRKTGFYPLWRAPFKTYRRITDRVVVLFLLSAITRCKRTIFQVKTGTNPMILTYGLIGSGRRGSRSPSDLMNRERSAFGERKRFVVDPEQLSTLRPTCARANCRLVGSTGNRLRRRSAGCFHWVPSIASPFSPAGRLGSPSVDPAEIE